MANRKRRSDEAAIANETYRAQLRRQIRRLKQLPTDFRDIIPGTKAWEDFAEITGRTKEMDTWLHGPVVILGPLSRMEKVYFRRQELIEVGHATSAGTIFEQWIAIIQLATKAQASFIYVTTFDRTMIDAWNRLLSHFDYKVRMKGQLLDETGVPIGIRH